MTVLEYLDEWCASLTKLSPAQREAKFFDLLPFDRGRALNGLVDRFARAEELRNGYLRDLGDTTRACDSLKRELADTQRSLKAVSDGQDHLRGRLSDVLSERDRLFNELHEVKRAKERWPQDVAKIEELTKALAKLRVTAAVSEGQCDLLRREAVRERANTNNLGISLTRLQLQANGWKEENEQLRKERDQLRKEVNEMENCANKVGYDNKQLKEELDLLNRNHAKLLAVRDEQLARSVAALESVRVSRFWKLVTELGLTPKHAKSVISEAEEIVKDLGKPA